MVLANLIHQLFDRYAAHFGAKRQFSDQITVLRLKS